MINIYSTAELIIADTISGIIKNLPWFILIYWSVKTIAKDMPKWLNQWDELKMKHYRINKALSSRGGLNEPIKKV